MTKTRIQNGQPHASKLQQLNIATRPMSEAQPPVSTWVTRLAVVCTVGALTQACIGQESNAKSATQSSRVDKDWSVPGTALVESKGAFDTGVYRNVFAEMGKDQTEITQRIAKAYDTYFSTTDANRLYYEFSPVQAYIMDIAHDDIRSEGMSYGMMLAVQHNDQARFDKLWNFANAHMRIVDPKHPSYRGYAWVVDTKGQICDENSAPDGEEYFAMTLYFAHNRWGSANSTASNNYKYWADELLDVMKNRPPLTGTRVRRIVTSSGAACVGAKITDKVTSVPLFDVTQKQPLFNATLNENFTDPSYHLPAFYNLFALWGPAKDAAFWNSAAATSRSFLARAMNANTGLVSEYANFDGSPHAVSWNSLSTRFAYDSWRVGGNVGMDWAWMMQPGTQLQARADALVSFFASKGPTTYLAVCNVDGTNESGFHSPGLIAMNAVATLATTDAVKEQAKALVEDLWNTELPSGKYRYYDGLLYTFAMLHLSGEYKIYMPQTKK
jgi:oligosaccharide reducing-end xylanase